MFPRETYICFSLLWVIVGGSVQIDCSLEMGLMAHLVSYSLLNTATAARKLSGTLKKIGSTL